MNISINIETDNDAFSDSLGDEVERIMKKVTVSVSVGNREGKCYDYNGNVVGDWKVRQGIRGSLW
jgi:hypothetical protein